MNKLLRKLGLIVALGSATTIGAAAQLFTIQVTARFKPSQAIYQTISTQMLV